MSQSGASQMVHHLERDLGVKLIDRSRRPLVLTPEGEVFYEGCHRLVTDFQALRQKVRALHEDLEGRLRLASIYSVGLCYLKPATEAFRELRPKVEVEVHYEHPERVYELVSNDQADLGLVSYPRATRQLEARVWLEEPLVLACTVNHPLAEREEIALEELAGLEMAGFDRGLPVRQEIDRTLAAAGVETRFTLAMDNVETIKQAVEVHDIASLLPAPCLAREVKNKVLRAIPLRGGPLRRTLGVVLRRGKEINPAVQQFEEILREQASRAEFPKHCMPEVCESLVSAAT